MTKDVTDLPTFARQLRKAMLRRGLDRESLARAMDKSPATCYNWLGGRCTPTWADAVKLSSVLDHPLDYFAKS
jgi:transcriptional regulator with XRE-family HTH domain